MPCTCCRQTLHSIPRVCYTPRWYWGKEQIQHSTPKGTKTEDLQNEIESGCVKQATRYWLSLPTLEAHELETHPVKQAAVFSQKVNPVVAQMIAELVADGITEIDDVKKVLWHRINHYLCKDSPPDPNDWAYFPTHDDLSYLHSPYLSTDVEALNKHFDRSPVLNLNDDNDVHDAEPTQQSTQNLQVKVGVIIHVHCYDFVHVRIGLTMK